jgi:hypothetical protein
VGDQPPPIIRRCYYDMNTIKPDKNNKEWKDWCLLYEYVKKEILKYDNNMKLPKFIVLRLRGLNSGRFMANKRQKPYAHYGYDVILLTFKACKQDILKYTSQNVFKNEQHKFNYIMVIIENNINDIVLRLKNSQKQKEKIRAIDTDIIQRDDIAKYKKKTKEITNKRLNDLW